MRPAGTSWSLESVSRPREGEYGWTQQKLAVRAGMERTYLSAVEQGRQNLSMRTAFRIAAALHTPLSHLMP